MHWNGATHWRLKDSVINSPWKLALLTLKLLFKRRQSICSFQTYGRNASLSSTLGMIPPRIWFIFFPSGRRESHNSLLNNSDTFHRHFFSYPSSAFLPFVSSVSLLWDYILCKLGSCLKPFLKARWAILTRYRWRLGMYYFPKEPHYKDFKN